MTTAELLNDVRTLTGSNIKDYPDAEIQRNIDQEYYLWQQIAADTGTIEWTSTNAPDVLDVTLTGSFEVTLPNMNIMRVEADIDGQWIVLHKTTSTTYGQPEPAHTHWCTCNLVGSCQYCRSLTNALAEEGTPHYYIQTNSGIKVFPIPDTGTLDIKIYYQGQHILNWGGGDTPRLPTFSHRILSLQACLLYRDIDNTGDLNFILSERTRISNELTKYFKGKTRVQKMFFTKKSYL